MGTTAMNKTLLFASIVITAAAVLAPEHVIAGGLYLNQAGTGAGNPANHTTASSAWLNPAGMTGLTESAVDVSAGVLVPWVKFDPSIAEAGGNDGNNAGDVALLPTVYAVKKMSDKWALGFTMTAPFGGGVDYGDNFVGRYGAQRALLMGVGIGPSVGFKVNDKLSLGAGVQFQYTNFDMKIAINTPGALPDGTMKINGIDGWGEQYFGGLTYAISPRTVLGILYKSESDVEIDGDIEFGNLPLPVQDAKVEVDWTFPAFSASLKNVLRSAVAYSIELSSWQRISELQSARKAVAIPSYWLYSRT
jgi:long-chain fatty acid transport protein